MGALVGPDLNDYYYPAYALLALASFFFFYLLWCLLQRNSKIKVVVSLVIIIACLAQASALFDEAEEAQEMYEKDLEDFNKVSYTYRLELRPSNMSNYTVLLPYTKADLTDAWWDGNINCRLEETEYGLALKITGNGTIEFGTNGESSPRLSMEAENSSKTGHYIFLETQENNTIFVDLKVETDTGDAVGGFGISHRFGKGWHIW